MNVRRWLPFLIALLIVALVPACKTDDGVERKDKRLIDDLAETALEANKHLKWQDYEYLTNFIDPEMKEDYQLSVGEVEDRIHMQQYQILSTKVLPAGEEEMAEAEETESDPVREGRVTVKFIGYNVKPYFTVSDPHYVEKWIRKDGTWYLQLDLTELLELE